LRCALICKPPMFIFSGPYFLVVPTSWFVERSSFHISASFL
jgi:hypothetical protein